MLALATSTPSMPSTTGHASRSRCSTRPRWTDSSVDLDRVRGGPRHGESQFGVSLPGGGFAATSFRDRGTPIEPLMTGAISGAIWEWHTDPGWAMAPGSETSGPNGIEISPDGRWFYLAAWGTQAVAQISRGRTPVERDELPTEFRVDNLRLAPDGSILATGQGSKGSPMTTSNVARVDTDTWQLEEIIRHENDETFGTGTGAVEVGYEIWVGSLRGNRIARFPKR